MSYKNIPQISLKNIQSHDPQTQKNEIDLLANGLARFGVLGIKDTSLDKKLLATVNSQVKKFFSFPIDQKCMYLNQTLSETPRGYFYFSATPPNVNDVGFKEAYHIGRPYHCESPTHIPNIWPEELPKLEQDACALFNQLENISDIFLSAVSMYFGEDPNYIQQLTKNGDCLFRILNYPELPKNIQHPYLRTGIHEDLSVITIMPKSELAGLEYFGPYGDWLKAEEIEGEVLISAGEFLTRMSNDFFKCPSHRVVSSPKITSSRVTMPMFIIPRLDAPIKIFPKAIEMANNIAKYPEIDTLDYLKLRVPELPRY